MDARVQALERALLGYAEDSYRANQQAPNNEDTLIARINRLSFPHENISKEIDELWQELNPGTALVYETKVVAPISYRRQEILAAQQQLRSNLQQVSEILKLLSIDQQISNKIKESEVTQAPILLLPSSTVGEDSSVSTNLERLGRLELTLLELKERCDLASNRLDRMLSSYSAFIHAVSNKLVALKED